MMNVRTSSSVPAAAVWHEDLHFGPASVPIDIGNFLSDAKDVILDNNLEQHPPINISKCDVSDLADEVEKIISNPSMERFIRHRHESTATHLFMPDYNAQDDVEDLNEDLPLGHASHRKYRHDIGSTTTAQLQEDEDVARFREEFDSHALRISKIPKAAKYFIRKPRTTDQNSLPAARTEATNLLIDGAEATSPESGAGASHAVLSISIHTPITAWPRSLRLTSKHEFLSRHTLADLVDIIPCHAGDPLEEQDENVEAEEDVVQGWCVGIEGIVYGSSVVGQDDASELLSFLANSSDSKAPPLKAAETALEHTRFDSLSLRINYPYWLFHAGGCEHICVLESIHLHRAADPALTFYPFTTFLPPTSSTKCRICHTLPAEFAVNGDERLGESPCLICKTCWDALGWPRGEAKIDVVRLRESKTVNPLSNAGQQE